MIKKLHFVLSERSFGKKAVSISILYLVISAFVLSLMALTIFYFNDKKIADIMRVPDSIDLIYIKQRQLDYNLQEVFENAVKDFEYEDGKIDFIDRFKKELGKYKDKEFRLIEAKVSEENIELTEEKLVFNLRLELELKDFFYDEFIDVKFPYSKNFIKLL